MLHYIYIWLCGFGMWRFREYLFILKKGFTFLLYLCETDCIFTLLKLRKGLYLRMMLFFIFKVSEVLWTSQELQCCWPEPEMLSPRALLRNLNYKKTVTLCLVTTNHAAQNMSMYDMSAWCSYSCINWSANLVKIADLCLITKTDSKWLKVIFPFLYFSLAPWLMDD